MQDPQERSTICNSLFGGKSSLRGVYPHFVLKAFMDIKWIIPNKKCFWLRKLENIVTEPFELRCFYQMFPHLATLWKIVAENHSCSPQANLSPPPNKFKSFCFLWMWYLLWRQCFLVCPSSENLAGKQFFLVCLPLMRVLKGGPSFQAQISTKSHRPSPMSVSDPISIFTGFLLVNISPSAWNPIFAAQKQANPSSHFNSSGPYHYRRKQFCIGWAS
jgi:hypothetical protein